MTDKPIALPFAHVRGVISTVLTGMNFDLLPGNNVYCYTSKESPISELLWGGGGGGDIMPDQPKFAYYTPVHCIYIGRLGRAVTILSFMQFSGEGRQLLHT